ncbi:PREDICTED: transcription elongation factor B polypeptide 3 [Papilio xuthus]|uniref:Transcription elongation factor B polypeptide 3 n=1 Tax=Papilio xuthus TaxID=66420 RepID=A0AAJ7EEG5_PAPXU|nr:PREDICTED: transcription elongation factor B polypeptide 3 [Papilio xuthus]
MASVLDLIKHYQHAIEKYPHDEQKILKCINKLFQLDVTVQHLQETGVGRTVNALRKEPGDVGQAARALVYKWKVMVAAEESDQEADHRNDTSNYNGHISERDSEDSTPQSKSRHDQYEKSSKSSKSTHDYKHMNGDSSSHKRRHHSSEEEEPETKKSKHSSNNDDKYKRKCVKSESSESDTQDTDNSQSDSSESDTSQSSEEDRKPKHKIKEEKQEQVKSSNSSKHSSHSHKDRKNDSASEKRHDSSDKHSKHKSESTKSEKSSAEKLSSSHKQSSTKDKESSSNKKETSSHKSVEKEKKTESSSKHSSSKKESSNKSDKHKNSSEKYSNASEKHNSSKETSEKTKEKSLSKELPRENHKSRESSSSKHSSSSKDRLSKDRTSKDRSSKDRTSKERSSKDKSNKDDSSKDRSREKHSSSKESDHSQKSDKKHSSDSSKEKKEKHKKESDKSGDDKKKHSHSSSKSSKSSSSKSTEDIPKKKAHISHSEESGDDGIDCGSGASFAEALGMISPTKNKKKNSTVKEFQSPNAFPDLSPASLLAPTAKLAPLPAIEISALPEISPNYKPRPPPKLLPHFTDEDAMSHVISSKNQRTKVYSGNKVIGKIPTLYEMCVHVLQEHIDALEYTGGVPYEILKPVVDMASPQQLFMLEHFNPYLMEDTDHLWQKFCEKHFRNKQRQEMETWREMYMRCQEEQEHRLKSLTANIRQTQEAKKAPIKQTKMAYVDTVVKPPRNVLRKQAQHGTAHASTASPAARVASLASAPNVLRGGSVRPPPATPVSSSNFNKPKKAPLMQKALQFMRGRKR